MLVLILKKKITIAALLTRFSYLKIVYIQEDRSFTLSKLL